MLLRRMLALAAHLRGAALLPAAMRSSRTSPHPGPWGAPTSAGFGFPAPLALDFASVSRLSSASEGRWPELRSLPGGNAAGSTAGMAAGTAELTIVIYSNNQRDAVLPRLGYGIFTAAKRLLRALSHGADFEEKMFYNPIFLPFLLTLMKTLETPF